MKSVQSRTRAYLQAGDTIVASCNAPLCRITFSSDQGQLLNSYDAKESKAPGAATDFKVSFKVGNAGYYITTVGVDPSVPADFLPADFQCSVSYEKAH